MSWIEIGGYLLNLDQAISVMRMVENGNNCIMINMPTRTYTLDVEDIPSTIIDITKVVSAKHIKGDIQTETVTTGVQIV